MTRDLAHERCQTTRQRTASPSRARLGLHLMYEVTLRHRIRVHRAQLRARAIDRAIHAFARVRFAFPDAHPSRFHVALTRDVAYRPTGSRAHTLDVYAPTRAPRPVPTIPLRPRRRLLDVLERDPPRDGPGLRAPRGTSFFSSTTASDPSTSSLLRSRTLPTLSCGCAIIAPSSAAIPSASPSPANRPAGTWSRRSPWRRPSAVREPFARRLFDEQVHLRAAVATYGFLDLEALERFEMNPRLSRRIKNLVLHAAASYVGIDVRAGAAKNPMASPLLVLERAQALDRPLPPMFADAGTRDILLGDSRRLKAAVERHGGTCELFIAPGEIHGYDALVWRPRAREKWRTVHAFLAPHMNPPSQEDVARGETGALGHAGRA